MLFVVTSDLRSYFHYLGGSQMADSAIISPSHVAPTAASPFSSSSAGKESPPNPSRLPIHLRPGRHL